MVRRGLIGPLACRSYGSSVTRCGLVLGDLHCRSGELYSAYTWGCLWWTVLTGSSVQRGHGYFNGAQFPYAEAMHEIKYTVGAGAVAASGVGVVVRYLNDANYVFAKHELGTNRLAVYRKTAGATPSLVGRINIAATPVGSTRWMRAWLTTDGFVHVALYSSDPEAAVPPTPIASSSETGAVPSSNPTFGAMGGDQAAGIYFQSPLGLYQDRSPQGLRGSTRSCRSRRGKVGRVQLVPPVLRVIQGLKALLVPKVLRVIPVIPVRWAQKAQRAILVLWAQKARKVQLV